MNLFEMMNQPIELTPVEKEIDSLIGKSGFYLQTYRAIDAEHVLNPALDMVENSDVKWQVKGAVFRNMGQALFLDGHFDEAMRFFIKSHEVIEDGDDKAAVAGLIARYYLQEKNKQKALEYAEKALMTAKAPELKSGPYQIQGGVAIEDGDYTKALELMNKAAELAEESHCLTDLAMIIMDISVIFMMMGRKETALSEIYRAERYVKECHNPDLFMRCAIRRAKILYAMGKDEDAKKLICALEEQKC